MLSHPVEHPVEHPYDTHKKRKPSDPAEHHYDTHKKRKLSHVPAADPVENSRTFLDLSVFTIDPTRNTFCSDDGFSVYYDPNTKKVHLYIHISEPTSYMDANINTQEIFKKAFTRYHDKGTGKKPDWLLPEGLIAKASLRITESKPRNVMSYHFIFELENEYNQKIEWYAQEYRATDNLVEPEFHSIHINEDHTLSYDTADTLIKNISTIKGNSKEVAKILSFLNKQMNANGDSKKIIDQLMIRVKQQVNRYFIRYTIHSDKYNTPITDVYPIWTDRNNKPTSDPNKKTNQTASTHSLRSAIDFINQCSIKYIYRKNMKYDIKPPFTLDEVKSAIDLYNIAKKSPPSPPPYFHPPSPPPYFHPPSPPPYFRPPAPPYFHPPSPPPYFRQPSPPPYFRQPSPPPYFLPPLQPSYNHPPPPYLLVIHSH